jgi:hypothetical protein
VREVVLGTALEQQPTHPAEHRPEQVQRGVRLVVQARPQHAAPGVHLRADSRDPGRVGREHQRPVLAGVAPEVLEQRRRPHPGVEPALLLGRRQALAAQDASLQLLVLVDAVVDRREAAHV